MQKHLFIKFLFWILSLWHAQATEIKLALPLTLENLSSIQSDAYLVSQKLDGMRAYWDGKRLFSKSGKVIHAPQWFLADFPPFALDGELWNPLMEFEQIISIIKNQKSEQLWEKLTYNIFEVPNQKGNLTERLGFLEKYLKDHPSAYLKIIPQRHFSSNKQLQAFFNALKKQNAEGIILRLKDAEYQTGRSRGFLKYKVYFDSECRITGYDLGKGKYENKVGSILCVDENTQQSLKIGSGFSDDFRENPPKIGTLITYKYYKKTKNNRSRHPIFLRIKSDF